MLTRPKITISVDATLLANDSTGRAAGLVRADHRGIMLFVFQPLQRQTTPRLSRLTV